MGRNSSRYCSPCSILVGSTFSLCVSWCSAGEPKTAAMAGSTPKEGSTLKPSLPSKRNRRWSFSSVDAPTERA
uniref:Putative secreted protein n=1 Tax=Ixodes ricinus TaxID=34613 RepID=A0A6B0TY75_IXORI